MCNCLNMRRDPVVELAGLPDFIQMSEHHPDCEDYEAQDYVRVVLDGTSCICDPVSAAEFTDDGTTHTPIRLTADQFENLPEFEGF